MKAKLLVALVVLLIIYSSFMLVSAETKTSVWSDEMSYQSLDDLQVGGWTVTNQAGVSFSDDAVVLDGTQKDTSIHYSQRFPSGISDWKVEDKSRWTLGSHCGNSVTAVTDKHSYTFMVDGWYGNFVFYRDGQKTTFGSFQENKNTWFTLSIEKQGNQINMYYNGEIKSTYTETDTSTSNLIGVDAVSPWKGGSEYDYFEVWQIGDTSTQEAQQSLLSNPIVLGGIIGAVGVGVGGVLYFFVFGGSGASGGAASGATGGAAAGSTVGGTGSSSGGGGIATQNHPAGSTGGGSSSNLNVGAGAGAQGLYLEQTSHISQITSILQDFVQGLHEGFGINANYTPSPSTEPFSWSAGAGAGAEIGQEISPELLSLIPPTAEGSLTSMINQAINQGQQLTTVGAAQGAINQDSYQEYLEQTTNLLDSLSQQINAQQTANGNAAHIYSP